MTTSVATQPNPDGREIVDSPQRGGRWRGVRWERYGTATFFVVFYLVVAGSNGWGFLSFSNIISVLSQNSHTAFAATAVTVTLIAGQFDLSVGALVGLSSTLVAVLTASQGLSLLVAVPLVILIAAAMGLLNGLLVTRVGVNAFIATLGTGTAFTGIVVLVTNGGYYRRNVLARPRTQRVGRPGYVRRCQAYLQWTRACVCSCLDSGAPSPLGWRRASSLALGV